MERGNAKEILARYLLKIQAIVGGTEKINLSTFDAPNRKMLDPLYQDGSTNYFIEGQYYLWLGETYVQNKTVTIAGWHLKQLQGCCGVCVSHGAAVWLHRKKGLGTLLNQLRIDIARNLGYGVLLATDVLYNDGQRKIFKRNGWTDVHTFTNPRTDNTVAISVIDLCANPHKKTEKVTG